MRPEDFRGPLLRRKQREVVMTRMDEAIFSEALRGACPDVVFLDGGRRRDSLAECRTSTVKIQVEGARVISAGLEFVRSRWQWDLSRLGVAPQQLAFDAPMLVSGLIAACWNARYPEHAFVPALQRKAWRIIERIGTNRLKGGSILSNTLEFGTDVVKLADVQHHNASVWAGHHALEWCAAGGPRRMLDGAFRPCDDWALPGDRWYRTLRRRAEERYGPHFGLPSQEPSPAAVPSRA